MKNVRAYARNADNRRRAHTHRYVCDHCHYRKLTWDWQAIPKTLPFKLCKACLIELVGLPQLRHLKALHLIDINLPPENPDAQLSLFVITDARFNQTGR